MDKRADDRARDWITRELVEIQTRGLKRSVVERELPDSDEANGAQKHQLLVDLSSNDYLGLSHHPNLRAAGLQALEDFGPGALASRVLGGSTKFHAELETKIAQVTGQESALVFGSGYLANLGFPSVLTGRQDYIVSDKLVHASLLDGIYLSRAKHRRFRHNDLQHLGEILAGINLTRRSSQRVLVLSESVFSMDGDSPNFSEMDKICRQFDAMLAVDEAHAFGLYGERGGGIISDMPQSAVLVSGSFGKSCAGYGGFIACSESLRDLIVSTSRAFLFNTGLAPVNAAMASAAIDLFVDLEPRQKLKESARTFREELSAYNFSVPEGDSAIVPVLLPGNEFCLSCSESLCELGFKVPAIRSPSVPVGSERLRFSLNARHRKEDLERLANQLSDVVAQTRRGNCE